MDGFKLFLGAVDVGRLNRAALPEETPQTFEKFLPNALALDLDEQWAKKFSFALAAAGVPDDDTSPGYAPSYYIGRAWNDLSRGNLASSTG